MARPDTVAGLVSAAAIKRSGVKQADIALVVAQLIKDNHPASKLSDAAFAAAVEKLIR